MRFTLLNCLLLLCAMCISGCGESTPATEEGAWLGEGTFFATAGTEDVKAQLELLSDGTYRFLILEPRMLMMAGVEKGDWTRTGNQIDLSPDSGQSGGGGGILSQVPKDFRPKTLTIEDDYSSMDLEDGKMVLEFTPNPEATKKLKASGEVY